ncbi:uncharacterized protein [Watersipora subatra]|uniref:uncharacterized protein n=1 Tax=Watersipora subatra TaxID=2589382 RepID=UPI00355B6010
MDSLAANTSIGHHGVSVRVAVIEEVLTNRGELGVECMYYHCHIGGPGQTDSTIQLNAWQPLLSFLMKHQRRSMLDLVRQSQNEDDLETMVMRINTHGAETAAFENDQAISSKCTDNDKRRSVRLERGKLTSSWGFTLQSYGIYNSTKRCIENYTYVDYVELKSPAYLAGMKRGDIIFAVDGQSTDNLSHEELVEKIKVCKSTMRMVLVNSKICQKVELHQRRQKLQALLRQKQSELLGLEKREAAIFIRAKARAREREMEEAREAPLPENHYCSTLLVTENNNTVQMKLPPEEVQKQRDVRPKLSPVNPSTDSKIPAKCQIRHEKASPVSSGKSHRKHNPHSLKASKAKLTQGSPTLSKISKQSTKTFLNPSSTANGTKLTKGMSKLALTDEPTAYERILFAQSRQPTPPDSLALRPLADSPMFRSVRHSKSPPAVDPLYRSMRLNKSSDSQSQQEEIQLG